MVSKKQESVCISQCENNFQTTNYYKCPIRICVRPLRFLLYIDDLPTVIEESQVTMFADATSLLKSGEKGELSLQSDLERISNWFVGYKLFIKFGKCEICSFDIGVPQELHLLEKHLIYLGLHLDGSLRFCEHIEIFAKNLNMFCCLIYRIREQKTRPSLLMFCNSFAESVISYALLSLGTAAKTNLMKVDITSKCYKTVVKRKCLENSFWKIYKYLLNLDLIPQKLSKMTKSEMKSYVDSVSLLYVRDNREVFSLFFF